MNLFTSCSTFSLSFLSLIHSFFRCIDFLSQSAVVFYFSYNFWPHEISFALNLSFSPNTLECPWTLLRQTFATIYVGIQWEFLFRGLFKSLFCWRSFKLFCYLERLFASSSSSSFCTTRFNIRKWMALQHTAHTKNNYESNYYSLCLLQASRLTQFSAEFSSNFHVPHHSHYLAIIRIRVLWIFNWFFTAPADQTGCIFEIQFARKAKTILIMAQYARICRQSLRLSVVDSPLARI